jgi:hypothetical protein
MAWSHLKAKDDHITIETLFRTDHEQLRLLQDPVAYQCPRKAPIPPSFFDHDDDDDRHSVREHFRDLKSSLSFHRDDDARHMTTHSSLRSPNSDLCDLSEEGDTDRDLHEDTEDRKKRVRRTAIVGAGRAIYEATGKLPSPLVPAGSYPDQSVHESARVMQTLANQSDREGRFLSQGTLRLPKEEKALFRWKSRRKEAEEARYI